VAKLFSSLSRMYPCDVSTVACLHPGTITTTKITGKPVVPLGRLFKGQNPSFSISNKLLNFHLRCQNHYFPRTFVKILSSGVKRNNKNECYCKLKGHVAMIIQLIYMTDSGKTIFIFVGRRSIWNWRHRLRSCSHFVGVRSARFQQKNCR
jgi:hypothetical protein